MKRVSRPDSRLSSKIRRRSSITMNATGRLKRLDGTGDVEDIYQQLGNWFNHGFVSANE